MKKMIISCLATMGLFAAACHTQKKMTYDFPPAMAANIQAEFSKLCDRGGILYNEKCAHCHNIKVKGKMQIPDFPEEKLLGYALRVSNMQHESNMPDTLVTAEDLSLITTFLTYKPKNKLKK